MSLGDARALLVRAAEEGIDTIDTAIGSGEASVSSVKSVCRGSMS
jgi:hypothetical protein